MATLQNPLLSLLPDYSHLPADARREARGMVRRLRATPKGTVLVQFMEDRIIANNGDNDRIWLAGPYARYSMREAQLAQVFYGDITPDHARRLQLTCTLDSWFEWKTEDASAWDSLPQAPAKNIPGRFAANEQQVLGVYSRRGMVWVTAGRVGETKDMAVRLTPKEARYLALAILGEQRCDFVSAFGNALYCTSAHNRLHITLAKPEQPGVDRELHINPLVGVGVANRILRMAAMQ